jgi:hypothetical protein
MSDRESDAIDEELTAYLDGELTTPESAALEQRLVDEEALRKRLAELRKAYDLLDELPDTPHSKSFTQTTIEMVIADLKRSGARDAVDSKQTATKTSVDWKQRWFSFPYALVPPAISLLIGSLLGLAASVYRSERELGVLDLASNLPGLHDVGDLQILQELAEDQKLIGYLQEHYRDAIIPPVPSSYSERMTWIRGLNAVQTAKLSSARELLGKYPSDVRQRMEAIQTQIDGQANPQELNLTAKMVGMVFDSLPTSKRQLLPDLSTIAKVGMIQEQLAFRAAIFYSPDLQGSDSEALEDWSNTMLLPSIVANIPFLRRETDAKSALMALYSIRPIEEGFRLDNQDALVADLASRLSEFPKRLLEGVDATDQLFVISSWMIPEGVNSNTRTLDAYERLRREVRDEIDMADPKEFRRLLRDRSRRNGNQNRPVR